MATVYCDYCQATCNHWSQPKEALSANPNLSHQLEKLVSYHSHCICSFSQNILNGRIVIDKYLAGWCGAVWDVIASNLLIAVTLIMTGVIWRQTGCMILSRCGARCFQQWHRGAAWHAWTHQLLATEQPWTRTATQVWRPLVCTTSLTLWWPLMCTDSLTPWRSLVCTTLYLTDAAKTVVTCLVWITATFIMCI